MKREIKFRFLLSTGKITRDYTVLELLDQTQENIIDEAYECNCALNESQNFCEGDCITIEEENAIIKKPIQYTGLKDKNGVEVCEGDILESIEDNPIAKEGIRLAVKYSGSGFVIYNPNCCVTCKNGFGCIGNLDEALAFGKFKVIGNIYQNQELLNKE